MVYIPPLTPWAWSRQKTAQKLFDTCLMQARKPAFFEQGGVPDTFDGRFEMVVAFVALLTNRLNQDGRAGAKLAQSLFDVMFLNFELGCRESGIGDLSIPRHMKRMMSGFNGRLQAYREDDLTDAVRRNIFGTIDDISPIYVDAMKQYISAQRDLIQNISYDDILNQRFTWGEFKGVNNNETRHIA